MVTKRITQETDVNRLAERVWNFSNGNIEDRNSFDGVFNDYMGSLNQNQTNKLRKEVFDKVASRHKKVSKKRFSKNRFLTLQGEKKSKVFNILAFSGGKSVFAHKEVIKVRGKKQTRLRDRKGRFAKAK